MSPRGVWGCSPEQLQSLQEPRVLSENSCAFYIPLPLYPASRRTRFPPEYQRCLGKLLVFICLSWGLSCAGAHRVTCGERARVEAAQMLGRCEGTAVPSAFQEVASWPRQRRRLGGEGPRPWRPSRWGRTVGCAGTEASEAQASRHCALAVTLIGDKKRETARALPLSVHRRANHIKCRV